MGETSKQWNKLDNHGGELNTPELDKLEREGGAVIRGFLLNNDPAIAFIKRIFSILHIWDDLIDKDMPTTEDEINACFWMALIELPADQFYRNNFSLLHPILVNSILNWMAANKLERTDVASDKEISYILRGSYIDLLSACALIVGGKEWAMQATAGIRRWEHEEGFAAYLNDLTKEVTL